MKTILADAGYIFDPETQDIQKIFSEREAISRIYIAKEDCNVRCYNEDYTAKAGDIIIVFYDKDFPHQCVTVTSENWLKNINDYNKLRQEEKERWALKKCEDCNSCDCKKSC